MSHVRTPPLLGNVTHKKTVWDMIAQSASVVSTSWYFTPFSASMKGLHQTRIYICSYSSSSRGR